MPSQSLATMARWFTCHNGWTKFRWQSLSAGSTRTGCATRKFGAKSFSGFETKDLSPTWLQLFLDVCPFPPLSWMMSTALKVIPSLYVMWQTLRTRGRWLVRSSYWDGRLRRNQAKSKKNKYVWKTSVILVRHPDHHGNDRMMRPQNRIIILSSHPQAQACLWETTYCENVNNMS